MDGGEYKILPINLALGGQSWGGWHFSPWGRARDWRLIAPDGASYTAEELLRVRSMACEIDYLRQRVALLEDSRAIYIGMDDCTIIRDAVMVLDRVLPRKRGTTK